MMEDRRRTEFEAETGFRRFSGNDENQNKREGGKSYAYNRGGSCKGCWLALIASPCGDFKAMGRAIAGGMREMNFAILFWFSS